MRMKTILVVDDNKMNLATARTVLSNDYKVIPVMRGQQALTYLESSECDIVLLDINMPDMDGFEVLQRIRSMEKCRNIPVIFLTADNDADTETRCFKAGAVDFIAKPFVPEVMASRISRALEIEQLRRTLADKLEQKTRESQQDALTGLWDREYTEDMVNGMLKEGVTGALMMIDIDNFKSVNDVYGHSTGDKMLRTLADTLRKFAAEGDVLCRIGGDEFVVFIKDASVEAVTRKRAMDTIADLNDRIEEFGFEIDTSISIGIACVPDDGQDFTALYSSADKALYYVKRNGKNSFHFFSEKIETDAKGGQELVDLKYLQELLHRTDSGRGVYLLALESFQCVYNFIRRYIYHFEKEDATMLLFTLEAAEDTTVMEALEKVIGMYLRRSDVTTRYSNRQIVVILTNTLPEKGQKVAERVIERFNQIYPAGPVRIEYSVARVDKPVST